MQHVHCPSPRSLLQIWRLSKQKRRVVLQCNGQQVWEQSYLQLNDNEQGEGETLLQLALESGGKGENLSVLMKNVILL